MPLKAPKPIAVFGNDAGEDTIGLYYKAYFEFGTLDAGGGAGRGRVTYLISPLAALQQRAKQDNTLVQFWLNNTLVANSNVTDLWVPAPPEACLVFLKTWATEGSDRENLSYNGNEVVDSVVKLCNNTIVITHSSGINELPFANHPDVTAILAVHYPGRESGNSIVDVLYGHVNPSGKLPYTIAKSGRDYNAPPTTEVNTTGKYDWQAWFDEKLEVDYRYFDSQNHSVLYEFGYGLSYSSFSLSDIKAKALTKSVLHGTRKAAYPAWRESCFVGDHLQRVCVGNEDG